MSHQKRIRMQWPIPSDWDGENWDCCILFFPDSPQWRAVVKGNLETLVRGWSWDETTGSVTEVQEIARFIPLTFDVTEETRLIPGVNQVMSCFDELVNQVTRIADILEAQSEIEQIDYTGALEALPLIFEALDPEVALAARGVLALIEIMGFEGELPALPGGD